MREERVGETGATIDLLGVLGVLLLGSRLLESEGLQLVLALLGDGELLAVLDLFLDWDLLADLVLVLVTPIVLCSLF